MKITNMTSDKGNKVANQYIIKGYKQHGSADSLPMITKAHLAFQSYDSLIAEYDEGQLLLDAKMWNCSTTTSKYRNQFTGLTTGQTKTGIDDGSIILTDLNNRND